MGPCTLHLVANPMLGLRQTFYVLQTWHGFTLEEKHVFSTSLCDKILVAKDILQLKSL